jgi:hypothetical protein
MINPYSRAIPRRRSVREGRFNIKEINHHVAIFGETGSGKSGTLKVVAEVAYDKKFKILDIYDGASDENCYWALPSEHLFWGGVKKRGREPRGYPTRLLFPFMLTKLPKKLPDVSVVFRIPILDLGPDDLKALLGKQISSSVVSLWGVVNRYISHSTTGEELLEILKEAAKGKKGDVGAGKTGLRILYNILEPLVREGLLCNSDDPLALDLHAELREHRKSITALVFRYVPPQFANINLRSFLVQHITRRVFEMKQASEGLIRKQRVLLLLREIQDFLSKGGSSDMGEADLAVRDTMIKVIKQGRKFRLFTAFDTQSPSMLHSAVYGQFRLVLCHRIMDYDDLDNIISPAVKDQMTTQLKLQIGELPMQFVVVLKPRERRADGAVVGEGAYITKMLVPRSRLMEEGDDFFDIYLKKHPDRIISIEKMLRDAIEIKEKIKDKQIEKLEFEEKEEEYEERKEKLKKQNPEAYRKKDEENRRRMLELAMKA